MQQTIISVSLFLVGIIHLLPITGVLGAERLAALYGIPFDESNLEILMRHRAVLFGLLGALLVFSAFKTEYQLLALIAGFVSVISFIMIAWSTKSYNEAISRVVIADLVALFLLSVSAILYFGIRRGN